MNPTPPRLLVAVPTMGAVHPILASRLIQWGRDFKDGDISFYFAYKVSPVDRARNQIVEYFLAGGFTHLLMIDSDTIPESDAVERLLSHDKEVISGLTPILRYTEAEGKGKWETYDNCFIEAERDPETGKITRTFIAKRHTGLQPIFRCGASCLLVKREVFEKLEKPYFRFVLNDEGTKHTTSEDIFFCDRLREAGVTLYADTEVVCQHHKDIML